MCPNCHKIPDLCFCSELPRLEADHEVVILQHPQEPDKDLGSARLAHLSLVRSQLKVGLSWPNLKRALGREEALAQRWAVLYLGSGTKNTATVAAEAHASKPNPSLTWVNKVGAPLPEQTEISSQIEGIILLDGTWSQAKTLWWRNPWLLKLRRAILTPSRPSLYRELRREPRRECLSTIESIGQILSALGEKPEIEKSLNEVFSKLLDRQRAKLRKQKQP